MMGVRAISRNQMTAEGIRFGFASEEDAALFGLHDLADLEASKPEISVVNLGSYTQETMS
jgi:hypothetical protein